MQTSSTNLTALTNNATRKVFISLPSSLHPGVKSTVVFLSVVIMIFGVSSNLFVLSVKVQQLKKKMTGFQMAFRRSVTAYLMISLSISDILTAILNPTILMCDIFITVMYRGWACKISRFIIALSFTTTVHNLFLISIEQHLGIFYWDWLPSPLFIKRAIFVLWIEAFLASFASFVYITPQIIDVNSFQYTFACQLDLRLTHSRILFSICFIMVYAIPLVFMTYSAFAILHFNRKKKTSNLSTLQQHKLKKSRIFTNVFYAFVIPYSYIMVYGIVSIFIPKKSALLDMSVRYFGSLLAFSNCCINPLIYFYKSSACREIFMRTLSNGWQRVRCRKNKVGQQQMIPLQNIHPPLRCRQQTRELAV